MKSRLSRNWRFARKNNLAKEVQEESKKKYEPQKKLTAKMAGEKKSEWEKKKIKESWRDGKNSGL